MLLHPTTVTFGALTLDAIIAVAIDRAAAREVVEFSDAGPHAVFADVPEEHVRITLTRRLLRPDLAPPRPGQAGTLVFTLASGHHDAGRARFAAECVVESVRHQLNPPTPAPASGRSRTPALQTITLIALSPDGATDPVTLAPV